ncbi:MAG: hypothetical protein ERJ67_06120 [Aphanocapsa feldmannii 277cV]|uniref:DUF475 domain-containing protein n=1 Tax=Aphanocapsa feldmannii 277cV TaxID=2507553 RepID=A0A524RN55_9CHRO|nr:MAG: hypothetical protein ERJ67_06120 [Aphanocapsa feldmannii 277cV]
MPWSWFLEADRLAEVITLLPVLLALELVLSADNAVALAAIARRLPDSTAQRRALNFGLGLALVLRVLLILCASVVIRFWPLQLAGAAYLLWLAIGHFLSASPAVQAQGDGAAQLTMAATVATIAATDMAFSLDSVAAAVAVSNNLPLVISAALLGLLALRLLAEVFMGWLSRYANLESAGYLAVGLVGVRLLLRLMVPQLVPPEWALLAAVGAIFFWGFSQPARMQEQPPAGDGPIPTLPALGVRSGADEG